MKKCIIVFVWQNQEWKIEVSKSTKDFERQNNELTKQQNDK